MMSAPVLTDADVAAISDMDLASWVLQGDLLHQDFCDMARETHSHSAGLLDGLPLMTSADERCDVLIKEDSFALNDVMKFDQYLHGNNEELPSADDEPGMILNESLDLEDLMREEIEQQQRAQQLQYLKQQDEQELLRQQQQEEQFREQQQPLLQYHPPSINEVQDNDTKDIIYEEVQFSPPREFSNSFPSNVLLDGINSSSYKPCIISVPVIEAFMNNSNSSVSSDQGATIQIAHHSKPIVINVKKVSLPSAKNNASVQNMEPPKLTLKEAVQSPEADDFLRELITSEQEEVDEDMFVDDDSDESNTNFCSPMMSPDTSDYPDSPCSSSRASKASSRSQPYSLMERKLRKKEQNKRAALRYRQKKKEEEEFVFNALQKEEERQRKLIEKYESVSVELKLMKKLARQMLVAQGKLKK